MLGLLDQACQSNVILYPVVVHMPDFHGVVYVEDPCVQMDVLEHDDAQSEPGLNLQSCLELQKLAGCDGSQDLELLLLSREYGLGPSSLLSPFFHNPRPNDLDLIHRLVFSIRLDKSHSLNHPHTALHPTKDRMLPVQPRSRRKGDEELAAIRVGSAVRHTQNSSSGMLQPRVNLVLELLAVNRASSPAGTSWIAGLDHEVGDNAVEDNVVVIASLRKCREILACLEII